MRKTTAKTKARAISPSDPYSDMSEFQIQCALFAAYKARGIGGAVSFFAVPNGGTRRDVIEGKNLQRSGCRAGCPDTFAFVEGAAYALEIKKIGGKLSREQKEFHRELEAAGVTVLTLYGFLDAVRMLEDIGVLMRPAKRMSRNATAEQRAAPAPN